MVDFSDNPEQAGFRQEVCALVSEFAKDGEDLAATVEASSYTKWEDRVDAKPSLRRDPIDRGEPTAEQRSRIEGWRRELVSRGWLVPHWPKEYGGADLTAMEQFILNQEVAKARLPQVGGALIGPILILFGTEEQKRRFLPGIANGTDHWAQGYSEPGAGSDLASLQTRAVREGDEYVVNGQKIWTSRAERSKYIFTLVRTDPDAPKHRGISMLLIETGAPGLTIRPLYSLLDEHRLNEVFFEDVRVPAANLVGEENRGWYIGATLLDFERSGIGGQLRHRHMVAQLCEVLGSRRSGVPGGGPSGKLPDGGASRAALAQTYVETEVSAMLSYRVVSMQHRGLIPNYEASISKVFTSELGHRVAYAGVKVLGLYSQLIAGTPYAQLGGRVSYNTCMEYNYTVGGGTSEIQRNIIATRGLGLPRG
jgi:alkylation response protein AidB-like acyl-CoA dehydrogenase